MPSAISTGDATKSGEARPRSRWRTTRLVVPLVVLTLLTAMLASPQSASAADERAGAAHYCGDFLVSAFQTDSGCCDEYDYYDYYETSNDEAQAQASSECCEGSVGAADCDTELPEEAPAGPTRNLLPPPPPLEGPTWMGPITPELGNQITFHVPPLLAIFIATNEVVVTNDAGLVVFTGVLPLDRTMLLSSPSTGGAGDYLVESTLTRGSKYTEVVTVGLPLN